MNVPTDARMLVHATLLTWVMLVAAAFLRTSIWTPSGLRVALGNRDEPSEVSPLAGRADRAARNMLENLILFVALTAAARFAEAPQDQVDLGARLFFYARLLYFPVYLAGVTHLRTVAWVVSVSGLVIIGLAAL